MKKLFAVLVLLALVCPAPAQLGGSSTPGLNAAMIKMFGETKAFSAQAEARILDKELKEISILPMTVALREGKLRAEMDLSELKGGQIPAEAAAMLKGSGMDRMVTLILPEKKLTVIMYPGLNSYAEMANAEETLGDEKFETAELGSETLDGHACTKTKFTTTDAKGKKQDAIVWKAKDLKGFPIQMQVAQKNNTMILKFKNPKLEQPEASLFVMPSNYTKYPSVQALMQAAMMKMFTGGK